MSKLGVAVKAEPLYVESSILQCQSIKIFVTSFIVPCQNWVWPWRRSPKCYHFWFNDKIKIIGIFSTQQPFQKDMTANVNFKKTILWILSKALMLNCQNLKIFNTRLFESCQSVPICQKMDVAVNTNPFVFSPVSDILSMSSTFSQDWRWQLPHDTKIITLTSPGRDRKSQINASDDWRYLGILNQALGKLTFLLFFNVFQLSFCALVKLFFFPFW